MCVDINFNNVNLAGVGNINGLTPSNWAIVQAQGSNKLVRWDNGVNKNIKSSGVTLGDSNEMYGIGALSCSSINTGQGYNEVYAMNQNVRTTDNPTFASLTLSSLTFGGSTLTVYNTISTSFTVQESAGINASVIFTFVRTGPSVIISWPEFSFTTGGASAGASASSTAAFSTTYRPYTAKEAVYRLTDDVGGVFLSPVILSSAGTITFYRHIDLTTNFSTSTLYTFKSGSLSFNIYQPA